MRLSKTWIVFVAAVTVGLVLDQAILARANEGPAEAPPGKLSLMTLAPDLTPVSDYRGDLWRRTTLLGDLAGRRQELYEQRIALDLAMTLLLPAG